MSSLSPRHLFLLDMACKPIAEAFDACPYLVGTAQAPRSDGKQPRDVDVRLILDDGRYDDLGNVIRLDGIAFLGLAIGQYLAGLTGLPIDFQIQRRTEANEKHDGPRNPLGRRSLRRFEGDAAPFYAYQPPTPDRATETEPSKESNDDRLRTLLERGVSAISATGRQSGRLLPATAGSARRAPSRQRRDRDGNRRPRDRDQQRDQPGGEVSTNFQPIEGDASSWGDLEPGVRRLNEEDREEITNLLMGHKITKVDDEHLLLDNGTVIKAIGHDGGCACSAGCYDLSALNGVDNIITRVEFDYHPAGDDDPWDEPNEAQKCPLGPQANQYEGHYRIFVYADNQQINLMQFDGSDGNGYYGTGFEILVRDVQATGGAR